ncbi:PD-(D/E)XK motif protein [Marinobacter sp.]|uniref:PD-(D/E)XK motif protein n=1 Tax=Marinobacter sp. TaxID=50741 RepID=UPI0019C8B611|nr:PD-(D/E)XK motif protein [Marinobacter sp.]MBC7191934.1 PD-(D/E)XK motif protein [Marinobacter sp.]
MTSKADPWSKLDVGDARRLNTAGRFDFFWVVLENHAPGLMLKLPSLPEPLPKLPKLKNMSLSFRKAGETPAFVIVLNDKSHREIFETLCSDVVSAGESAATVGAALSRTVKRTQRWHYLLRGGVNKGLSLEEQRGLVGELAFLRELAGGLGPDAAVDSWKGPSRSAKDFEFMGACVEVKARRVAAKPEVTISSEDQLADVAGCRLFLRVWDVASAVSPEGLTLHDHVNMTADLLKRSFSALDQWEETLHATGYEPENDYDGRRWHLGEPATYEIKPGFPRVASPLPLGVSRVKYALSLDACANFRSDVDLLELIREFSGDE